MSALLLNRLCFCQSGISRQVFWCFTHAYHRNVDPSTWGCVRGVIVFHASFHHAHLPYVFSLFDIHHVQRPLPPRVARHPCLSLCASRFWLVGLSLRTLLVNLLDDIPDTWPILVVSTWEGKPGESINGEGGALGDGGHNTNIDVGMGMGMGMGGSHGTMDVHCAADDDWEKKSGLFSCSLPCPCPCRRYSLLIPPSMPPPPPAGAVSVLRVGESFRFPRRVASIALPRAENVKCFCQTLIVSSPSPPSRWCSAAAAAPRAGSSKQLISALLGGTRGGGPWGLGADGGGSLGDVGGRGAWGGGGAGGGPEGERASWNGAIEMRLTGDTQRESFVDGERWNKKQLQYIVAVPLPAGPTLSFVACSVMNEKER